MTDEAIDRVRAAFDARQAPSRKDYERVLREQFHMPARLARRVASETMRLLRVPEDGDAQELVEQAQQFLAALARSR